MRIEILRFFLGSFTVHDHQYTSVHFIRHLPSSFFSPCLTVHHFLEAENKEKGWWMRRNSRQAITP